MSIAIDHHVPRTTRPPDVRRPNPVRIGRIGTDHVQVFVRPTLTDDDLEAVAGRIDQLISGGYDTIEVIFDDPNDGAAWREVVR